MVMIVVLFARIVITVVLFVMILFEELAGLFTKFACRVADLIRRIAKVGHF